MNMEFANRHHYFAQEYRINIPINNSNQGGLIRVGSFHLRDVVTLYNFQTQMHYLENLRRLLFTDEVLSWELFRFTCSQAGAEYLKPNDRINAEGPSTFQQCK